MYFYPPGSIRSIELAQSFFMCNSQTTYNRLVLYYAPPYIDLPNLNRSLFRRFIMWLYFSDVLHVDQRGRYHSRVQLNYFLKVKIKGRSHHTQSRNNLECLYEQFYYCTILVFPHLLQCNCFKRFVTAKRRKEFLAVS